MIVIVDQNGRIFSEFKQSNLTGTAFPKFDKPAECTPVQITVFDNQEDAKALLDLVQDRVMNHRMMHLRHGELRIVDLTADNTALRKQIEIYERMRPHWAQGYTDDGIAAQGFSNALSQLWEMLGTDNQTTAVGRLRDLLEKNK